MDAQLAFYSIVLNWSFTDNEDDNNQQEIKTNRDSYDNKRHNSIFEENTPQQPPHKKRKLNDNNHKPPLTPPPPLEPTHDNNSPKSPLVMKIPKINGKLHQNETESHKKKSRFKRAVGLKSGNKSQQNLDFHELFPVEKFKRITKFHGDSTANKAQQLSKICTFPNILAYKEHFAALLFDDLRARLDNQINDELKSKWKHARDMLPAQLIQDIGHKEYICCSFQILSSNDNWLYYVNTKMLVFIIYNLSDKCTNILPCTHLLAIIDEQPTATHIKLQIHLNPKDERYVSFIDCFDSEKRKKKAMKIIFLDNIQNRMREFRAICAADKLILKDIIIDPKSVLLQHSLCAQKPQNIGNSTGDGYVWSYVPDAYKKRLGRYLNSSQCKAIEKACKNKGITLLQGPPGTGKTRTVLHLMNAYHIGKTQAMFESWLKTMYNKLHTNNNNNNNNNDVLPIAKPRILVAAPSNAAVDEIIVRLMNQQFVDGNDFKYSPPIIRIGNMDKCRIEVGKQVSLHSKVDAFLNHRYNTKYEQHININKLNHRIRFFKQKKLENESKLSNFINSHLTSYQQMSFESFQQNEAQKIIHFLQERHSSYVELQRCIWVKTLSKKSAKDKLITSILLESEIIFTTLNSAGGRELRLLLTENEQKHKLFDHCIIDEAGQCTEPDILIPLRYDIDSVVLVGDPQQLPATVFAQGPSAWLYERSLFERLMSAGYPTHLLDTQYRMHPEISFFPNLHFYGDKLKNGHNVLGPKYMFQFHTHKSGLYGPFLFFNISSSSMKYGAGGHSLYNRDEVAFIIQHLESFYCDNQYKEVNDMQIGIITPYKQQQKKIIDALRMNKSNLSSKNIEVATVDFYQGREKDIVFFSCVRAGGQNGIGFLSDIRRMNVAITRAKYSLWIVGNNISLQKNPDWNELIKHAKKRKCLKIIKYNKQMKRYQTINNKRENKIFRIPRPTLLTDNNNNRNNNNNNNSNNNNRNNNNNHNNSVSMPMIIDYGNINQFNNHRNNNHHHHHHHPHIMMPQPHFMRPHIIHHPNHPIHIMQQHQIPQNDPRMIDYIRNHTNNSAFDD